MTKPFVGPPDLGPTDTCAFAPSLDTPRCTQPPAVHIQTDSPWGKVALNACPAHVTIARAAGQVIAEHPWGPGCDGDSHPDDHWSEAP